MIRSFANSETETFWLTGKSRKIGADIRKRAFHKLQHIEAAHILDDLKLPPGNNLEKLSGNRKDYYSIRINRQWRICFLWKADGAYNVEIVDYH